MSENKLEEKDTKSVGVGKNTEEADKDRKALRWMGFGIEFIGVMAIFSYAGWWADQKLDTGPWLMLIGFAVAFTGMIYLLYKETANLRK